MPQAAKAILFKAEAHPIRILAARSFTRAASAIFSQEELTGFANFIGANPAYGKVIPGTSGLRKARWKAKGSGKRGGARVIYFFRDLNMPILLLAVYAKNERANLCKKQLDEIESKIEGIIEDYLSDLAPDDVA
ncbi:type II toxin-antitoxin system RelE/ParE family toxin [Methylobacterium adhaesivum]|uniref:Type II toxin-antitoxin system RelE/ParE family toxin n=1 Tax=Methylobacterium adhaesivum TaxID=333297 RepID=A0ABT8BER0_9HYPH|nr:type II toxin-antitoxin system RelE/ParE family toxin [Methylobacterium adhaesivum]MDN3590612.1 type II toxin-antitoxin system RelE/ParE family toxin [Methylobacterium adhaesivum]